MSLFGIFVPLETKHFSAVNEIFTLKVLLFSYLFDLMVI